MSGTYYEISRKEMVECLEPKGFEHVEVNGCREMVFDFEHPKAPGLGIRVYSSISYGAARAKGEDAIRCIFWSFDHGRPIGKTKRIHRIETWEKNLTNRLRLMAVMVTKMEAITCPVCSAPMAERNGKHGKFYGCITYPDCKGTRQAEDVDAKLETIESGATAFLKKRELIITTTSKRQEEPAKEPYCPSGCEPGAPYPYCMEHGELG